MKRAYVVNQADLRMDGDLAMNVKRVLPVTQADVAVAAAQGIFWNVKRYEVVNTLDNLRGGTQRILKVNAPAPGVQRAFLTSATTIITVLGAPPLALPDAIEGDIVSLKAFGGTEQRDIPEGYVENQFVYMMDGSYLLTNIIPEYGYRIEMDMQTTTTKATPVTYLGAAVNNDGIRFAHVSNKKYRVITFGDTTDSEGTVSNNARLKYTLTPERVTIYEDGVQKLDYAYTATSTGTSVPLAINAYNNNGTIVASGEEGIYLYSLKIWNTQNELVMDLVPATKLNPLTVGFYDRITGQHLTATAGTFAAGGEAVPTPDAPIDIVCNNGVLKARRQSGLPGGYTELEYIQSDGGQYIITDLYGQSDNVRIDTKIYTPNMPSAEQNIIGNYTTSGSDAKFVTGLTANKIFVYDRNSSGAEPAGNLFSAEMSGANTLTISVIYDSNAQQRILTYNGTTTQNSYQRSIQNNAQKIVLLGRYNGTTTFVGKVYYIKYYEDGVIKLDLIPAKNSSGVVGMYDLANNQFYTNQGSGSFIAGTTVPIEIYTDGTQETINVHSKNLWNPDPTSYEYFDVTASSTKRYGHTYRNGTYTVKQNGEGGAATIYSKLFSNGSYGTAQVITTARTFTVSGDDVLLVYSSSGTATDTADYDIQVERGATATDYQPYFDCGSAVAEMLLAIGDDIDQQEIIDGTVTRKVGIKVLDGTEDWVFSTAWLNYMYSLEISDLYAEASSVASNRKSPYCTHFGRSENWLGVSARANMVQAYQPTTGDAILGLGYGTPSAANLATFKAWLATQYANGTPVIVVYPLKTVTTETVTGQPMTTTQGDNVVEITQASMDGLELEVTYNAGVTLTVEEVQDAQLSPDVEVTIQ